MKAWTTWVLVLATACGGASGDDGAAGDGSEGVDGSGDTAPTDDDDDDADDENDDDDGTAGGDDDDAASTGEADTGGLDDTGEESTGASGLASQVTWQQLLPIAEQAAAGSNPAAELSLIAATGMQADGTIDLADLQADANIEFRFSQVAADTGVSVNFSAEAFDALAADYTPSSVYPVNGNGFVSDPLWDVELLPPWSDVAQAFSATAGCGGFSGSPDDVITIRVDSFYPVMVLRAATATTTTMVELPAEGFPPCT